jgi:succinyl-diaminopimelate desuccinylase
LKGKGTTPAFNFLKSQASEVMNIFSRLIALDTSFPPGKGYGLWADALEEILSPMGFIFERVVVPEALWKNAGVEGERINLIAKRGSTGNPLSIYFHSDTVPAGEGWSRPAHQLTIEGENIYGRGTADMKGTIAAVIGAIKAMDAAGEALAYDPVLLFCTDEEGGKYPGVRYLAEQNYIKGQLLCLNGQALARIWAGCFGSLDLRLRFKGRAAHSGDGQNGVNAIEESIPVLNALLRLKCEIESRTWSMPPPPTRLDQPLASKMTISAAHGGTKGSALPALIEIIVNRRYAPEEPVDSVVTEIRNTIQDAVTKTQILEWDLEEIGHLKPVANPVGEKYWPRWIKAYSEGFGWPESDFKTWGAVSSSDMGWVQNTGLQEILLGGLSRPDRNVHAADEHTTKSDLLGLSRSIIYYLRHDFYPEKIVKT